MGAKRKTGYELVRIGAIAMVVIILACVFQATFASADGLVSSDSELGMAFNVKKEDISDVLDDWLWNNEEYVYFQCSKDWSEVEQKVILLQVITGNYLKNGERVYARSYGVSKNLYGYDETTMHLNPENKEYIDLFEIQVLMDHLDHVAAVIILPVAEDIFIHFDTVGYRFWRGASIDIPAQIASFLTQNTTEESHELLSKANAVISSNSYYCKDNIVYINGYVNGQRLIFIGATNRLPNSDEQLNMSVSDNYVNTTDSQVCAHEYAWQGSEKSHWGTCVKCGLCDESTIEPHWRFCTEEKCAVCGLPYYNDAYYMEHTGELDHASFIDDQSCCWIWACCGTNEIREHSYPDFGEEDFEAVDNKYHTFTCSLCHSMVKAEHDFDEGGQCYECGYVRTMADESQSSSVMPTVQSDEDYSIDPIYTTVSETHVADPNPKVYDDFTITFPSYTSYYYLSDDNGKSALRFYPDSMYYVDQSTTGEIVWLGGSYSMNYEKALRIRDADFEALQSQVIDSGSVLLSQEMSDPVETQLSGEPCWYICCQVDMDYKGTKYELCIGRFLFYKKGYDINISATRRDKYEKVKQIFESSFSWNGPNAYGFGIPQDNEISELKTDNVLFHMETVKRTNVREKMNKNSKKITTLNAGVNVAVVGADNGDDGMTWYKILLEDGTTGYARNDFFREVK